MPLFRQLGNILRTWKNRTNSKFRFHYLLKKSTIVGFRFSLVGSTVAGTMLTLDQKNKTNELRLTYKVKVEDIPSEIQDVSLLDSGISKRSSDPSYAKNIKYGWLVVGLGESYFYTDTSKSSFEETSDESSQFCWFDFHHRQFTRLQCLSREVEKISLYSLPSFFYEELLHLISMKNSLQEQGFSIDWLDPFEVECRCKILIPSSFSTEDYQSAAPRIVLRQLEDSSRDYLFSLKAIGKSQQQPKNQIDQEENSLVEIQIGRARFVEASNYLKSDRVILTEGQQRMFSKFLIYSTAAHPVLREKIYSLLLSGDNQQQQQQQQFLLESLVLRVKDSVLNRDHIYSLTLDKVEFDKMSEETREVVVENRCPSNSKRTYVSSTHPILQSQKTELNTLFKRVFEEDNIRKALQQSHAAEIDFIKKSIEEDNLFDAFLATLENDLQTVRVSNFSFLAVIRRVFHFVL